MTYNHVNVYFFDGGMRMCMCMLLLAAVHTCISVLGLRAFSLFSRPMGAISRTFHDLKLPQDYSPPGEKVAHENSQFSQNPRFAFDENKSSAQLPPAFRDLPSC